jgi:hypothetical protein
MLGLDALLELYAERCHTVVIKFLFRLYASLSFTRLASVALIGYNQVRQCLPRALYAKWLRVIRLKQATAASRRSYRGCPTLVGIFG